MHSLDIIIRRNAEAAKKELAERNLPDPEAKRLPLCKLCKAIGVYAVDGRCLRHGRREG
jgi:hypothetical protein